MTYETDAERVGTTTQVVVGLFKDANDAHQAVTELRAQGFSSDQIGAAFRGSADAGYPNRSNATGAVTPEHESWWDKVKDAFRPDERAESQHGAAATRSERELDSSDYSQSEYDYDFAGEEFAGSLTAAGIPVQRAAYLTQSLTPGGAIVTVRDPARAAEAEEILSANGAQVHYEEATGGEVAGMGLPAARGVAGSPEAPKYSAREVDSSLASDSLDEPHAESSLAASPAVAGDRVQLFGEVLRLHKERISRGEVRIRKDVITENQTVEVPVTHEELVLERVPVSGTTPAPSANIGRDQEIRVPLSEETVRVEKQPVLREEVIVGKRDVSDVATVNENLRHEELLVDSDTENAKRSAIGEELPGDARRRG